MTPSLVDAEDGADFDAPFNIAGFWLWPVGSAPAVRTELGLELDPGGVFGSGLHPTTQLCLERLLELPPAACILDVGTGTGILALAALQLGVERAVLLDLDPRALEVAALNAARNGLSERVEIEPDGLRAVARRFPRVVANMPSAELIEIAPALIRVLGSRTDLVLSGIYEAQLEEVRGVYRNLGLRTGLESTRAGWHCLEFWPSW